MWALHHVFLENLQSHLAKTKELTFSFNIILTKDFSLNAWTLAPTKSPREYFCRNKRLLVENIKSFSFPKGSSCSWSYSLVNTASIFPSVCSFVTFQLYLEL